MKDISIRGTIVASEDKWIYDWLGYDATCPKDIENALKEANGDDITFLINSGGGDVFAGNEINYLISRYRGKTIADVVGIAASIATVVCCGANITRMAAGAQYMIHNVSSYAEGDYNVMDKESKILQVANKTISNTYRLKTGMSEKELLDLMNEETWMDAVRARELGFCDEIIGDDKNILTGKTLYNASPYVNIISDEVKERIRTQVKNPDIQKNEPDFLILRNRIKIERMRGEKL